MNMKNTKSPRKGNGISPCYSHIGICVSDLKRAMTFYKEGLGFTVGIEIVSESNLCHFVDVPSPMTMISQFMTLGGLNIELLDFPSPGLTPAETIPKKMNQVGMTHLSFYVEDMEATAKKLESLGGRILRSTLNEDDDFGGAGISISAIFCTDPDGTRIELMCFSENFPGFV